MSAATTALATLERDHALIEAESKKLARKLFELGNQPYTDEATNEIRTLVLDREKLDGRRWGLNCAIQELRAAIEQENGTGAFAPIAEVLDPEAPAGHGRYVPVNSPRGRELLARG